MTRSKLFLSTLAALFLLTAQAYAWTARATADVNMRSGPGTRYRVILVIPRHATLNVRRCTRWCSVRYAGYRGYVSRRYLAASRYRDGVYIYRTPPLYLPPKRIFPPPYLRRPREYPSPYYWFWDPRRRDYRRRRY